MGICDRVIGRSVVVDVSDETSNKIYNISFICAVLVVMQHIPGEDWCWRHIGFLMMIAVPFFFCVSGFFLAGKTLPKGVWFVRELKKRLITLIIPYLIVTLGWYVLKGLAGSPGYFSWYSFVSAIGLNFGQLPVVAPLWYVRALFVCILMAPIVVCIVDWRVWGG